MTLALTKKNFAFVQQAQRDHSLCGQLRYQIGGRISSLALSLLLLAETVLRVAVIALTIAASLLSLTLLDKTRLVDFRGEQVEKASLSTSLAFSCFASVFSPASLCDRLANGPLAATIREMRLRIGADLIQKKLKKELGCAQNQMAKQVDGPFLYQEETLPLPFHTESVTLGDHKIGICHFQGRRPTMEDEHLTTHFDLKIKGKSYPVKLFGIFDGHGGSEAAKYLKSHLGEKLRKTLQELNSGGLTDEGIWNALKMTFVRLNQEFKGEAGSTAITAVILDDKLWIANLGDSRAILTDKEKILQLSEDAKPSDSRYQKGVFHRGGWFKRGRLNGVLAIPRAFGDHKLGGAVSARPKITAIALADIKPKSRLVLSCDGIYDVASTKQIGHAVQQDSEIPLGKLAQNIVSSAYHADSQDNLSTMVIEL